MIIGDWQNPKPTTIIGVVGDVRHNAIRAEPRPTVFLAQSQVPGYITYLVMQTTLDAELMARAVRHEVAQVDPRLPVTDVRPMEHYVATLLARPKLYAILLGAFAAVGVSLATIGLYGLIAYAVTSRTHEIGIRIAIGSQPVQVLRATFGQGARLVAAGVLVGVICAMAASRFIAHLLYRVGQAGGSGSAAAAEAAPTN